MRIHLGHHFYGAGNLGDDFMLAGFLRAMAQLAPGARLTCSVPFPLEPLRSRFPAITWLPYDPETRRRAISECDVWLGLGGSPFQHALSRWFLDHLQEEAAHCRRDHKPMFYLGVGVQTAAEIESADVRALAAQAESIWTRDSASADRLSAIVPGKRIHAAADLAHVFFRAQPPPAAQPGRICMVANFDFGDWPGLGSCLKAIETLAPRDRVWLAQESRELPGGERAVHGALSPADRSRWRLVAPDAAGEPLSLVFERWPSGEWLVTSRYHAALAGGWARSKVVVIATNEKLRAAARELGAPVLAPDATESEVAHALAAAPMASAGGTQAAQAFAACEAFVRAANGASSAIARPS